MPTLRTPRTGSTNPRRRRSRRPVVAATAVAAALVAAPQAAAAPAHPHSGGPVRYVALGDSYSSGLGIPTQVDTNCGRSDHDYPSLVAARSGAAAFTDVTCAGAATADMTGYEGSAPPQLDALRPDTTLVTLGIGGNDLDLTSILTRCVVLGTLLPYGAPCKAGYTLLGTDQVAAAIDAVAPKVDAVLREIRTRSPHAQVVLVGYPVIMPDDGGSCHDVVPLASGDAPWFRDEEKHLDTMLAEQAATYGATYVDTYTASIGHDVCRPAGTRWIEPADDAEAAGFHPNAAEHAAAAAAVLAAVRTG